MRLADFLKFSKGEFQSEKTIPPSNSSANSGPTSGLFSKASLDVEISTSLGWVHGREVGGIMGMERITLD